MLHEKNHIKQKVFAVANQKGGVGKTTTAINLATGLAAVGLKILLIDLDPQGNASTGLGIEKSDRSINSYSVISGETNISDAIRKSKIPNLDIIVATVDLLGAEIELIDQDQRGYKLDKQIKSLKKQLKYDFILIDCPPALGILTLNALTAADSVLVPLQCEFFALEGLSQLMKTVEMVKLSFNPSLKLEGIMESDVNVCVTYDPTKFGPFIIGTTSIPEAGIYSVCCAIIKRGR